ncbi:MAG: transporter substrate-binding protein [Methyloprofundus sp.]|nr:transporter substrate-binding protein [Methyloprofundus sp.]
MKKNISILLLLFALAFLVRFLLGDGVKPPIRVGILHSLSGTMAFSEQPLVDALIFAIEEVNAQGGVLGRTIEPIIVDGQSDWTHFAKEAERLIVDEQVAAIFGCWTSACRKAVKPVVEKYQQLLFYPVQYEGVEQSPNIIYTGETPNQQITPSIAWALNNLGKTFFLVGSDYVFPRTANQIIKDLVHAQQGVVLAEHYLPLGATDMQAIIADIQQLQPDVILNTINGDSNIAFFQALKTINKIPVISYSIAEPELEKIGLDVMQGHYAVWSYFQSIASTENTVFVKKFQQRFGEQRMVNAPMVASYTGLHLWIQAVKHAQSFDPDNIRNVIGKGSINVPEGIVAVDATTQHLWKTPRIGQVRADGQFDIIWQADKPIRPVPYPSYRSHKEWQQLVNKFLSSELAQ